MFHDPRSVEILANSRKSGARPCLPSPPTPSPFPASRCPSPGADGDAPRPRPVRSVTTAPERPRGPGLPGAAGLRRGVDRRPRPLRDDGPDGRGRLEALRAPWHRLAPAPRLRDGDLHHRRHLPAPGLPRRRRHHHRRRHPVDDRGPGHPPHRDAAREARHLRRHLPRRAAVGEPPPALEDGEAPLPEPRGPQGHAAVLARRWRAGAPHRRRPGRPPWPGLHPHADRALPRHREPGRPRRRAVGARRSTPSPTCWPGRARSATSAAR